MKLINMNQAILDKGDLPETFCSTCLMKFLLKGFYHGEIFVQKKSMVDFYREVNKADTCEETAEA